MLGESVRYRQFYFSLIHDSKDPNIFLYSSSLPAMSSPRILLRVRNKQLKIEQLNNRPQLKISLGSIALLINFQLLCFNFAKAKLKLVVREGFVVPPSRDIDARRDSLRKNPDGFSLTLPRTIKVRGRFPFPSAKKCSAPIREKVPFSLKIPFCESFYTCVIKYDTPTHALILVVREGFEPSKA
jgi:hypothetical protein